MLGNPHIKQLYPVISVHRFLDIACFIEPDRKIIIGRNISDYIKEESGVDVNH